jgi:hypothetical protein
MSAAKPENGNGISNKVLGWAFAFAGFMGLPIGALWMQRAADLEHLDRMLEMRDRAHEARQDALQARIEGQDTVLQREMRLLDESRRLDIQGLRDSYRELHTFIVGRARLFADGLTQEQR